MDTKLKNFAINLLRRGTFKHKPRSEARKRYKVKIGEFSTGRAKYGYQCAGCDEIFKAKETKMDHVEPVVHPIEGFKGFDVYIPRAFCGEENFQCVCSPCHDIKSEREKDFRTRVRHLIKKDQDLVEITKEYDEFLEGYMVKVRISIKEYELFLEENRDD